MSDDDDDDDVYVPGSEITISNKAEVDVLQILTAAASDVVKRIYLLRNILSKIPEIITSDIYPNLKYLSITYSEILEIPLSITNLKSLENLNLSNNKITVLPAEIGSLSKLRRLELENNEIGNLPPEIVMLTLLEMLNLDNNKITVLPHEIVNNTNLNNIMLSNNSLEFSAIGILDALVENIKLKNGEKPFGIYISIDGNDIKFPPIEEGFNAINPTDTVVISITTHGFIPLNTDENPPVLELDESINTFEIQRACSISAVNHYFNNDSKSYEETIKKFMVESNCVENPDACLFKPEFVEECKQIEGDLLCRISGKEETLNARFIERMGLRYPASKIIKKVINKKYEITYDEYFIKGKDSIDWKVSMFIKRDGKIKTVDITEYIFPDWVRVDFFMKKVRILSNPAKGSLYFRVPKIFELKDIIDFVHTKLGYKNIKVIDFSCAVFMDPGKESMMNGDTAINAATKNFEENYTDFLGGKTRKYKKYGRRKSVKCSRLRKKTRSNANKKTKRRKTTRKL